MLPRMCHFVEMKNESIILGENAFAAISAVEGLVLSEENRARINALRRDGLSNDQIRQAIIADLQSRAAA